MPELLTVAEAAEFLRMTPIAIYRAVERGQIPGVVKIGARLRFRTRDLRAALGLLPEESPVIPAPAKASCR